MRYPNLITAHAGEQPGTAPSRGRVMEQKRVGGLPRRTACAPRRELAYSTEGDGETAQPQQRRRLGGVVGAVCVLLRSSSEPTCMMNRMYQYCQYCDTELKPRKTPTDILKALETFLTNPFKVKLLWVL